MPEAKHYQSALFDSCYLYTLDEKFTAGVKLALDKGALNALAGSKRSYTEIMAFIQGADMEERKYRNTQEF